MTGTGTTDSGPAFFGWRPRQRRTAVIIVVCAVIAALGYGLLKKDLKGDFSFYYRAGRAILDGNAASLYSKETLGFRFRYLPFLALYMLPISVLPSRVATVLWAMIELGAVYAIFSIVHSLVFRKKASPWFLLVVAFGIREAIMNVHLGQINLHATVWALLGLLLIDRARTLRGGALLGLGTAIKFWPSILLVDLGLRGPRRAFAGGLAAFVLLAAILPSLILGWGRHATLVSEYLSSANRSLITKPRDRVVGQSLDAILQRYLAGSPYHVRHGGDHQTPHLDLDATTIQKASFGFKAAALVALFAWMLLRRPRDRAGRLLDAGILITAWLLFSPESRNAQYVLLTLPAAAWVRALEAGEVAGRVRTALLGLFLLITIERLVITRSLIGRLTVEHLQGHAVHAWTLLAFSAGLLVLRATRQAPEDGPAATARTEREALLS